jgi:hypothetical protein
MPHQSEKCTALEIKELKISCMDDLRNIDPSNPAVWLFILPQESVQKQIEIDERFLNRIGEFISVADSKTVLCFLTSAQTSAELLLNLQEALYYKLWVSVKYDKPIFGKDSLPNNHCALLILSKYKENLKHTKTRIAYSYCPACDKTTKDYGGKKHTYHEYGTLMSDVWRDISITPNSYPNSIIDRLKDVFGLAPYKELNVLDIKSLFKYVKSSNIKNSFQQKETKILNKKFQNVLINADCLEALKEIPSNSVDYCFADPPYNLKKKYDNWNDSLDIHDYFEWCDKWLYELGRIVKPGCTVSVLNIPLWAVRHYGYMKRILNFQNWIVWEGLSLPVRMIMPANYAILCFSKGRPRSLSSGDRSSVLALKEFYCVRNSCIETRENDKVPVTDLWWDIHRLKHNTRRVDHPCQLPPALMRRLILLFTDENEIVLDPFNGVGTTTLCADQINRKYIGIELSDYYHKIAQKRHKELSQGLNPFRKNCSTPKAKNNPVPRLKKQKYEVPKKILQLEVKKIAKKIGKLPTRKEVEKYSRYPIKFYDDYFISWGEVCAAARTTGMTEMRDSKIKAEKKEYQLELFS